MLLTVKQGDRRAGSDLRPLESFSRVVQGVR